MFANLRLSLASLVSRVSLVLIVVFAVIGAARGGDVAADVTCSEVWTRVMEMNRDLEDIRFYMGKPKNEQLAMDIENAETREVYFQALATFRNAERLCFQQVREHVKVPKAPQGAIASSHVLSVVEATHNCLKQVKLSMGIEKQYPAIENEHHKSSTDVFRAIVQANRQINLMLDKQVAPSDVFEQVTLGVGYASRLLEKYPNATMIPDAPAYDVGKTPSDVYRRLLGCLDQVQRICSESGISTLRLRVPEQQIQSAQPSDVYHLASLVVSELAYLHSRVPDLQDPPEVYFAGRKYPSDVYQRVGVLEKQLQSLEQHVNDRPFSLDEGKE